MKEPNQKMGPEKKDINLLDACDLAMELIDKGLQPGLAIWKAAQESGIDKSEIAKELGSRPKR
jgi:hypothetical protein